MLLTYKQVSAQLAISTSQLFALVASGQFPRPLKVGRSSRFLDSEVNNWVADRAADRNRKD